MRSRYRGGRWCGRGDAARRPPIPIKGHRPALMSTLPQVRCASNLPIPGRRREGPVSVRVSDAGGRARSSEGPLSERTSGHSDLVVRAALDASMRSLVPLPAFSSWLSYYNGCVALAARPICCRACATISVPTLIVASTRRARSTRAESRTARKSRTASPLRQVIPPPRPDLRAFLDFIQVHRRDQYRSHQELSAPANNRWLSGCVVARAGFPCAL